MSTSLYHLRRLAVSYSYQYLMLLIAWKLSLQKSYSLVLYFSAGLMACGIAFSLAPAEMAAYFSFSNLDDVALADVRAYYGTMLIALALVLAWMAQTDAGGRAALLIVAAFCIGSAAGRLISFAGGLPMMNIHAALAIIELAVFAKAVYAYRRSFRPVPEEILPTLAPKTPEEFRPLSQQNFKNPYAYYQMLRDDYPVYQMPEQGYYCISRYDDISAMARDTASCSSKIMEILVSGKPKDPDLKGRTKVEMLGDWGIVPVDVLAIQDQPIHAKERKIAHGGFNAKFVKSLESEVTALCNEMMDEFMPRGNVEFVQHFAWRLPMRLIIRLLGLPEKDFEQIKTWCMKGIRGLSGTAPRAELVANGAASAEFVRYLWTHYLAAQKAPKDNFTGMLISQASDPDSIMTDQRAISTMLQLLIAGSDSSASSMGNAIRMLAKHPEIERELRKDPGKINNFIEEVFRTESAFQGHFRVATRDIELHGVTIPKNARVFLMWASGNRDPRFWDNPDVFDMDRAKVKKHLTFGHGIHACIGRELARMEIRIVIQQLLARTSRIEIVGDAPFEASIFARTLLKLPLAFLPVTQDTANPQAPLADETQVPAATTDSSIEQPEPVTDVARSRCPFTGQTA